MTRTLACGAVLVLALGGCATGVQTPLNREPWVAREASLRALTRWSADGQLAIRSAGRGGQASWIWNRQGRQQTLMVLGPFGQVLFVLRRHGHGADTLQDSHGRTFHASNVGVLIRHMTGWRMPAGGLSYWIVGVPCPGIPEQHTLDPYGRLATLVQSGWTVRFVSYRQYGARALPRRLALTYPGRTGRPAVRLRLVINRWRLR